jgi:alanine racemase
MDDDFAEHGATLTIDLSALSANWRFLASLAAARNPAAKTGAVVKADAYGLGIDCVVPTLSAAGCETFFVAHLPEARRVRAATPNAVIYVLNGLPPGSADAYREGSFRPVLGSIVEIDEWMHSAGAPFALHVDTGMNRLGLDVALLDDPALGGLKPDLVMTHFAASEVPGDPANPRQIETFAAIARRFPQAEKSLLNSSGHFLESAPAYDLTRPGFALYGGNPTPDRSNPMKAVISLVAPIVQLREVEDGAKVGYNGAWTARGRRRLATISVGYADGYPRNASSSDTEDGGFALVGDTLCPFAGKVSMDLIIIDVSAVPKHDLERGTPAVLIGGELDIDQVSQGARTVGYEILTRLGRRYRRRYTGA